jgi:hypothetical protein
VLTLTTACTAAAVSLSPPAAPEGSSLYEAPEARSERLGTYCGAIAEATSRARCEPPWDVIDAPCKRAWRGPGWELAGIVLGLSYLESALAEWVHAGRCRIAIGECDGGRARGLPQLQRTAHTDWAWDELEGTGQWSSFVSAWSAVRVLSASRQSCVRAAPREPWLRATIAAYATGGSCTWPRAAEREKFVVRVIERIRAGTSTRRADLE